MARAYSGDLRERVIGAALGGQSARQAAIRYGVGISTAIVWVRRARQTGEWVARRQGKPRGSKLDAHADFLLELIEATCHISLKEMQARLKEERSVSAGIGTLWRFFTARASTVKKTRTAKLAVEPVVRGPPSRRPDPVGSGCAAFECAVPAQGRRAEPTSAPG